MRFRSKKNTNQQIRIIMVYYNRILRILVFDIIDYFLISALIGSLIAPYVKDYLSEKAAMERLKNSLIRKSRLVPSRKRPRLTSKEAKIKKIYKFALTGRGGQLDDLQVELQLTDQGFRLAQEIQRLVTKLAAYLKQRELKGILRIFFKHGRLVLELILFRCNINISYAYLTEGLSTQVIVFTTLAGGATGFTIAWLSVGASLVSPPLLAGLLFIKSFREQWINFHEYKKFKEGIEKLLKDPEIRETIRAIFEGDINSPITTGKLEMSVLEEYNNLQHDFPNSVEDVNAFIQDRLIKARMEKQLGLVENPTAEQLQQFIDRAGQRERPTLDFLDFIDDSPELSDVGYGADLLDSEIIDVDVEILDEPINFRPEDENGF
jgi:hypothetical protein